MSAASSLQSEDQFLCFSCLTVSTDPVTTPCGRNFCNNCITEHCDINDRCQCPMCNEVFHTRPELDINTRISEMAAQFRQTAAPGEVLCDVCTGTKLKALKFCLVCQLPYCQTHLEPHLTMSGLKRHHLIDTVVNLEGRMCMKHDKPLELFCMDDHTCVCMLCSVLDHKVHYVVPLKDKYKVAMGRTEAKIQQMIQERRLKIQEIKHSVKLSKDDADREIKHGVQVFTTLMETVERGLSKLTGMIKEKQTTKEKQAEDFITELEQEISELMKRSFEMKQLPCSENHLHLFQSFPAPPTKDWTEVSVHPPSCAGSVAEAVIQLNKTLSEKMKKIINCDLPVVQQYAVDVTLDPDTAHPQLILSDDGKQVRHGNGTKNLPQNPARFSVQACVLGKQSFSSGRFYFDLQVKGKTDWTLGVARESVKRKRYIPLSPEQGYWTMCFRDGKKYEALNDPHVCLSLKSRPEKVGVFVDYEEGLVSFYDVHGAALMYSFTGCSFTEKLYLYVSPGLSYDGKNSNPLIISRVSLME